MDYLLSGNLNRNPIEKLIDQMYFQNATSEGVNVNEYLSHVTANI